MQTWLFGLQCECSLCLCVKARHLASLTSSASFTERLGGPILGGVPILFAGTALAVNICFGFTFGGDEEFSVPLGTLGGVKGLTGGRENNGGVGQ